MNKKFKVIKLKYKENNLLEDDRFPAIKDLDTGSIIKNNPMSFIKFLIDKGHQELANEIVKYLDYDKEVNLNLFNEKLKNAGVNVVSVMASLSHEDSKVIASYDDRKEAMIKLAECQKAAVLDDVFFVREDK